MLNKMQRKILNKLLDLYEQSKTFQGTNQVNQSFGFRIDKLFPKYLDSVEYDMFCDINESAKELKDLMLIQIKYQRETVIERISLNVQSLERCYELLGRVSRKEEHQWLLAYWNRLEEQYQNERYEPLLSYIDSQKEKVRKNQKVEFYNSGSRVEYEDLMKTVIGALENEEEIFIRDFSSRVFHNSKRVERLKAKAESLLFCYGEFQEKETVFEELGIVATPTYVMLKGNGEVDLFGQRIDLSKMNGDIALSTASLQGLSRVRVKGKRVVTVENLTSFHDYSIKDDFVIYLGGFHNRVKRDFICFLYEQNEGKEYRHFGDIDAGGFYILEHLKRKTGVPFVSFCMGKETLVKYRECALDLTENDRKRLRDLRGVLGEQMRAGKCVEDYGEVIEYMLEEGVKLEQEVIGVGE